MRKPILSINDLSVNYDKFSLNIPRINIYNREIIGFIGANGAGKSTTINAIMGIVEYCGEISYKERIINEKNINILKQDIGYIGEYREYYPDVKVKHIINFISRLYINWDKEIQNYYINDLFKIDINMRMNELSTGTKVKLYLTIALSHNAELLILDEPTSGLDPIAREEILAIMYNYAKNNNKPVFFSSHITQDIEKIADRVIYIVNGSIKMDKSKEAIYNEFIKIPLDELSEIEKNKYCSLGKTYRNYLIIEKKHVKSDKNSTLLLEDILFYLDGGIKNEHN